MIAPRSHAPPAPPSPPSPPAPTPPAPPTGSWECHDKYEASVGKDTDLQKTGSDISSCQQRCISTQDCKAVMWHKTDNHCHIFTGSFSHDDFASSLKSEKEHESCFLASSASEVLV